MTRLFFIFQIENKHLVLERTIALSFPFPIRDRGGISKLLLNRVYCFCFALPNAELIPNNRKNVTFQQVTS